MIASQEIEQHTLERQIAGLAEMIPKEYENLTEDNMSVAKGRQSAAEGVLALFDAICDHDVERNTCTNVSNPSSYQIARLDASDQVIKVCRAWLTVKVEAISEIWHKALKQQESLDNPPESDATEAKTTTSSQADCPRLGDGGASGGASRDGNGGASLAEATASPAAQDEERLPGSSHADDAASAELGTPSPHS